LISSFNNDARICSSRIVLGFLTSFKNLKGNKKNWKEVNNLKQELIYEFRWHFKLNRKKIKKWPGKNQLT